MEKFLVVTPKGGKITLQKASPLVMSYRISREGLVFSDHVAYQTKGGYMCISDKDFSGKLPEATALYPQIISQCNRRQFGGVLLDFENALRFKAAPLVQALSEKLYSRRIDLVVDVQYAATAPHGRVLMGSGVSGGSFADYLTASCKKFGRERVALELSFMRSRFQTNMCSQKGVTLTEAELSELVQKNRRNIFYSRELCTNHFTYTRGGNTYRVLFDNVVSMKEKIGLARQLGIEFFVGFYEDLKDVEPL